MEPAPQVNQPKKPRLALAIATCFGLGYIPKAPGTAGSLAGVALLAAVYATLPLLSTWLVEMALVVFVAGLGVWASGNAALFTGSKDPQNVVIDEVSGQILALFAHFTLTSPYRPMSDVSPQAYAGLGALSWKYFLLGFILFRVFDIWKPWPVRQAEKLPGGWGIMADDWVAGIYAALGLWMARALGF